MYYYVIYLFMLPWRLRVKDPPVNAEVRYLGQEDPLEKEMATHSLSFQDNPMDRGAWRAIVHRFAKSWTRLNNWITATTFIFM